MRHVTQLQCTQIAARLNGRPRKRYGYESPQRLFAQWQEDPLSSCANTPLSCYILGMTELIEEAIGYLRQLPEPVQDTIARSLLSQLTEEPEPGDLEAIEEARRDFANGDFVIHEQWRRDAGIDGSRSS